MNADEMFEDLGYKKKETKKEIKFSNKKNVIWFFKNFNSVAYADAEEINIQEKRVINQKLKELHWI